MHMVVIFLFLKSIKYKEIYISNFNIERLIIVCVILKIIIRKYPDYILTHINSAHQTQDLIFIVCIYIIFKTS